MEQMKEILKGLAEDLINSAWCDCVRCHEEARQPQFDEDNEEKAILAAEKRINDLVAYFSGKVRDDPILIAKGQPFFVWEKKIIERLDQGIGGEGSAKFSAFPIIKDFVGPILKYAKDDADRIRDEFDRLDDLKLDEMEGRFPEEKGETDDSQD